MLSILANVAAALAMKLIMELWRREDIKDEVRTDIANKALELAARAHEWKSRAYAHVDDAVRLPVRPGAGAIKVQGLDPDADGANSRDPLHRQ